MNLLANFALGLSLANPLPALKPVTFFTACIDERPWIPYTNPNLEKPGNMQIIVYNASRDLQVRIEVEVLPWKRCLENVRSGRTDALIGASDLPFLRELAVFPKHKAKSEADTERSLGTARIMLVKRAKSKIEWDGTTLAHLQKPVGTAMGTHVMKTKVLAFGAQADDAARTDDQNIRKLLQGRVDLMAGYEFDLKDLIRKDYKNQVTILPVPLIESHYYLAFSKQFYEANKDFSEAIWNRIGTFQSRSYIKSLTREEFTSSHHALNH